MASVAELEEAVTAARAGQVTQLILIDTDAGPSTDAGGFWWDVAVPQVSTRPQVEAALEGYERKRRLQRTVN